MSQEDIWKPKEIGEENVIFQKPQIILKGLKHSLSEMEVRNYFNTHTIEQIHLNSIYNYFKDEMFRDEEGLYLTHLIAATKCIHSEKILKALDSVFEEISPNIGSLTDQNFNYFQYFLLHYPSLTTKLFPPCINKLYEIGIKHGLDLSYTDSQGYAIAPYYLAAADFQHIFLHYKKYILSENVDSYKFLNLYFFLGSRVLSCDPSYEAEKLGSKNSIFSNILRYSKRLDLGNASFYNSYEKNFVEIEDYCQSLVKKSDNR